MVDDIIIQAQKRFEPVRESLDKAQKLIDLARKAGESISNEQAKLDQAKIRYDKWQSALQSYVEEK